MSGPMNVTAAIEALIQKAEGFRDAAIGLTGSFATRETLEGLRRASDIGAHAVDLITNTVSNAEAQIAEQRAMQDIFKFVTQGPFSQRQLQDWLGEGGLLPANLGRSDFSQYFEDFMERVLDHAEASRPDAVYVWVTGNKGKTRTYVLARDITSSVDDLSTNDLLTKAFETFSLTPGKAYTRPKLEAMARARGLDNTEASRFVRSATRAGLLVRDQGVGGRVSYFLAGELKSTTAAATTGTEVELSEVDIRATRAMLEHLLPASFEHSDRRDRQRITTQGVEQAQLIRHARDTLRLDEKAVRRLIDQLKESDILVRQVRETSKAGPRAFITVTQTWADRWLDNRERCLRELTQAVNTRLHEA